MADAKRFTDEYLIELSEPCTDDGYPTIGELATEVLRLRKLVGKTSDGEFDFNRWIEATSLRRKHVGRDTGERTEVLILTDPKEIHFPSPEFQHCNCLIRFTSPGHPPCMAVPTRLERRVLESWGVLPKEIDEQS